MVYFAVYAHKICVVKILLDEAVISRWCPLSLLWGWKDSSHKKKM